MKSVTRLLAACILLPAPFVSAASLPYPIVGTGQTACIAGLRALENQTPLVLCNRVGQESLPGLDVAFLGKSAIIDASGNTLCAAPDRQERFVDATLEIQPSRVRSNILCSDFGAEMALHGPH